MGHLYMRCVMPFQQWPWELGRLAHYGYRGPEDTYMRFRHVHPCCIPSTDGFTMNLKRTLATPGNIRDATTLEFIRETFRMVPNSNIQTECRFARCRRHADSCQGRSPGIGTVCANHVLSEVKAMHHTAQERSGAQSSCLEEVATPLPPGFVDPVRRRRIRNSRSARSMQHSCAVVMHASCKRRIAFTQFILSTETPPR